MTHISVSWSHAWAEPDPCPPGDSVHVQHHCLHGQISPSSRSLWGNCCLNHICYCCPSPFQKILALEFLLFNCLFTQIWWVDILYHTIWILILKIFVVIFYALLFRISVSTTLELMQVGAIDPMYFRLGF